MPSKDQFSFIKTYLPGEFEPISSNSTIIYHYELKIDVTDSRGILVASRTKQKKSIIRIEGINNNATAEEIANSLIGLSNFLKEQQRRPLIKAIKDLRTQLSHPHPTRSASQSFEDNSSRNSSIPFPQSVSADNTNKLSRSLSKSQVEDFLHEALQKIHWGDENQCISTLQCLVDVAMDERNLALIIHHEPLMNTLSNDLRKYASSSLPACILIMTIFERMSFYTSFQESIARFKIGNTSLSLFYAQLHLAGIADQSMPKEEFQAYLKSQNRLLRLVISLLFNLSENPSAMRKMVNKGIVSCLTQTLKRRDIEILTNSLRFLRKISSLTINWSDVPYDEITPAVASHIFRWHPTTSEGRIKVITVLKEGIDLLFTFALHDEALQVFGEAGVFDALVKLGDIPELRNHLVRLAYQCSISEGAQIALRSPGFVSLLLDVAAEESPEKKLAVLVLVKLAEDREIAAQIAKSPSFAPGKLKWIVCKFAGTKLKEGDTETEEGSLAGDFEVDSEEGILLLQLVRNVLEQQKASLDLDQELVSACLRCSNNQSNLSSLFAIAALGKMTPTRAKYFSQQKEFVELIIKVLNDQNSSPQLVLDAIVFVAALVLFSASAQVFSQYKIVDIIIKIFLSTPDDLDIQCQCLFTFLHFACHTATRTALIAHNEIIDTVLGQTASQNQCINHVANALVEVLTSFDKQWAQRIQDPRFVAYNNEWLQKITEK